MRTRKKLIFLVGLCALVVLVFLFRIRVKDFVKHATKPALPPAKTVAEITQEQISEPPAAAPLGKIKSSMISVPAPPAKPIAAKTPTALLPEINLKIAFQTQAPYANWAMPYAEACEEASLIMIDHYLKNTPLDTPTMKKEILAMVAWEDETFGYSIHTNAADMVLIARNYLGYKNVAVKYDFTLDELKEELAAGHGVLLLAAGKLLYNPNFHVPGPVYHVLVVKGYTQDYIITNDSGTRNGADYLYKPDVLMNAAHDWDGEDKDITKTRRAMIVVEF